ncbi:MAG: DNA-processing protein DprA [Aquificaceae bacterium]
MVVKELESLPEALKNIRKPPKRLYFSREISLGSYVAIVGTRNPCPDSIEITKKVVRLAKRCQYGVVSGGANGIDFVAHQECLDIGCETIIVLACGLNKAPERLLELEKRGAILISEFDPDKNPARWRFRYRNRLISALSNKVIIIEAGLKSGALITARYALEQDKELWAYRGNDSERFTGCKELIEKKHAKEFKTPSEIFGLSEPEDVDIWLSNLKLPATFDEILEMSKMPMGELALRLMELEISGRIKLFAGRYFRI